jgi:hypothetical protein
VQHICRFKPIPERKKKYKAIVWKLEEPQLKFLMSEETLRLWSALTLKERVVLFHRKFPNKRVSTEGLRRLYLKHRVKNKQVVQRKGMPQSTQATFEENREGILKDLALAERLG